MRRPSKKRKSPTPIDGLLSVRTTNTLQHLGCRTLEDVVLNHSEGMLLREPNFGRKSLNELKEVLAEHGLRLGQGMTGNETADQLRRQIATLQKRLEEITGKKKAIDHNDLQLLHSDVDAKVRRMDDQTSNLTRRVNELSNKIEESWHAIHQKSHSQQTVAEIVQQKINALQVTTENINNWWRTTYRDEIKDINYKINEINKFLGQVRDVMEKTPTTVHRINTHLEALDERVNRIFVPLHKIEEIEKKVEALVPDPKHDGLCVVPPIHQGEP